MPNARGIKDVYLSFQFLNTVTTIAMLEGNKTSNGSIGWKYRTSSVPEGALLLVLDIPSKTETKVESLDKQTDLNYRTKS